MSNIGKNRRLNRLFAGKDKCIIIPIDDSLISGPQNGLLDLQSKISQIERAKPNAILAFSGSANIIRDFSIPLILNITASTVLGQHTNKVLVSSVEYALSIGADAVAVHLNISSKFESEMLKIVGQISEKCHNYGMPLMILAYPRYEKNVDGIMQDENYKDLMVDDNEQYTKLVAHCVRVAYELGADIIKTQYTGSGTSFKRVVSSVHDKPIVIAGGENVQIDDLFKKVEGAMKGGAAGVSIGRNIFNNPHSEIVISAIKKIVFENFSVCDAKKYYFESIPNDNIENV